VESSERPQVPMLNPFTIYAQISERFRTRLAEWNMAIAMTACGVVLLVGGNTFALEPYVVLRVIASEQTWGLVLFWVGALRLTVLGINGALPRGSPHFRAMLSGVSAVIWAVMLTGYLSSSIPSLMIALTGANIITEFVNIRRAAAAARAEDDGRGGKHGRTR
jgi:hypothetical protein